LRGGGGLSLSEREEGEGWEKMGVNTTPEKEKPSLFCRKRKTLPFIQWATRSKERRKGEEGI